MSAKLKEASLSGADLTSANLTLANLEGSDLTGVRGLTSEQITNARIDEKTRLPDELREQIRSPESPH